MRGKGENATKNEHIFLKYFQLVVIFQASQMLTMLLNSKVILKPDICVYKDLKIHCCLQIYLQATLFRSVYNAKLLWSNSVWHDKLNDMYVYSGNTSKTSACMWFFERTNFIKIK